LDLRHFRRALGSIPPGSPDTLGSDQQDSGHEPTGSPRAAQRRDQERPRPAAATSRPPGLQASHWAMRSPSPTSASGAPRGLGRGAVVVEAGAASVLEAFTAARLRDRSPGRGGGLRLFSSRSRPALGEAPGGAGGRGVGGARCAGRLRCLREWAWGVSLRAGGVGRDGLRRRLRRDRRRYRGGPVVQVWRCRAGGATAPSASSSTGSLVAPG